MAITNDIFEAEGKHYVSIFMRLDLVHPQIVQNIEPHKIEEWRWFPLNKLPVPLFLSLKHLLEGRSYGSAGEYLFPCLP